MGANVLHGEERHQQAHYFALSGRVHEQPKLHHNDVCPTWLDVQLLLRQHGDHDELNHVHILPGADMRD